MSYVFLAVYDIAVDTILLSVCEDEKINKSTGAYYASFGIRAYLDVSAAQSFGKDRAGSATSGGYGGI